MLELKIGDKDKKWLQKNYPELKIEASSKCPKILGVLKVDMLFCGNGKPYIIKPKKEQLLEGTRIKDEYQIEIIFQSSEHSNLPQVYEKGARIKNVAENKNLKLEDLHFNPSGAACLCIRNEESDNFPNGFNLRDFFNNLIIPFCYSQSYFEENDSWPWGQYSHGILGLLEWYAEQQKVKKNEVEKFLKQLPKYQLWQNCKQRIEQKSKIKGHHICICGKADKFRDCHKKVFNGLWKLRRDIKKYNIMLNYN